MSDTITLSVGDGNWDEAGEHFTAHVLHNRNGTDSRIFLLWLRRSAWEFDPLIWFKASTSAGFPGENVQLIDHGRPSHTKPAGNSDGAVVS